MTILSRLMAIGLLAIVAGCGTLTAESYLEKNLSAGSSFNECLAREYQERATSEAYVDCNWVDATYFIHKSEKAAAGANVVPFDPANFAVLPGDMRQLQEARLALLAALEDGGRTERGCACAKAQRYYDGWVEQSSDNKLGVDGSYFGGPGGPVQPDRVAAEKAAFFEAMTACEPAGMDAGEYGPWTIYFGWDKYNLTQEAMDVIELIVASVTSPVAVVGHTDTSGSTSYNMALGQRRANSVSTAVTAAGGAICDAASVGENDLAVPTGDGVREPLNRRAVVTICP